MKSRRRIAFTKAGTTPSRMQLHQGFATGERVQGSVCTAAILSRSCPLWVKSRHRDISNQCPLYPQKQTFGDTIGMSALCQKRTLRTAANIFIIRSPREGGRIARSTVSEGVPAYCLKVTTDKRCFRSSSEIGLPSEVVLIKTDDFHPVRALSCWILAHQLHSAACLVDRVG